VHDGAKVVHFSGHGSSADGIYFEAGNGGESDLISSKCLHDTFLAGAKATATELFVLSACYSENVGRYLAQTVKHVVAVKRDQRVKDETARAFSRHFYGCLFGEQGLSVSAAFHQACEQVAETLSAAPFILLPENDPVHDEVLSIGERAPHSGDWNDCSGWERGRESPTTVTSMVRDLTPERIPVATLGGLQFSSRSRFSATCVGRDSCTTRGARSHSASGESLVSSVWKPEAQVCGKPNMSPRISEHVVFAVVHPFSPNPSSSGSGGSANRSIVTLCDCDADLVASDPGRDLLDITLHRCVAYMHERDYFADVVYIDLAMASGSEGTSTERLLEIFASFFSGNGGSLDSVSDLAHRVNQHCGQLELDGKIAGPASARVLFVLDHCSEAISPSAPVSLSQRFQENTDIGGYLSVKRNPLCALVDLLCQLCPTINFLLSSGHQTPLVGKFEYLSKVRNGYSDGFGQGPHRDLKETVVQL